MMSRLLSVVKRHPIVTFFTLTYAITWGFLPFGSFAAFGPLVAAIVVISITQGLSGLRELGLRMIRWRVRWYWYALAIGLPLAVLLVSVALNVVLGAPAPSMVQFNPWYVVILLFAVRLVNPTDGPLGEEPGWRGFALPGLQASRSPLPATLVLALLVTVWHAPLLLPQFGLYPIELLTTFAITFWYAWLFNRTGGSVLLTIIAHSTQGIIQVNELWAAAPASRVMLLDCALWCVVAISLLVSDWKFWRHAPAPATMIPPRGGTSATPA